MTEPPSRDPQPSHASNSGGLSRVFVVDDESVIASTLASILKLNGYDVRHFVDPLEALDVPAEEGPELLISDVVMPRLSGVDLAIRMKEKCPTCKVLLFSGQAETADLLQTARQRGHQFSLLQKPVHPVELLAQINKLAVDQQMPHPNNGVKSQLPRPGTKEMSETKPRERFPSSATPITQLDRRKESTG